MKFHALLPLAVILLLVPSCFNCGKGRSTCYRKACTTAWPSTMYTQQIGPDQESLVEAGAQQAPYLEEEVQEEDELTATEGMSYEDLPPHFNAVPPDKETLDGEVEVQ